VSLPTVQPFDYPDWGAPGVLTASLVNVAAINGSGDTILELSTGYYNHTLLVFNGNGDGASYTAQLDWYTANPIEGGSLQFSQFVTVANGCTVVVPITNPTTFLKIIDALATVYPHNVLMTVSQFAQWGSMVGYPGGETVLYVTAGTSGVTTLVWSPNGCGPGLHRALLTTDAPTWQLFLRFWQDASNTFDILVADETTTAPFQVEWIAPASSWQFVFYTGEAGDYGVSLIATRLPT